MIRLIGQGAAAGHGDLGGAPHRLALPEALDVGILGSDDDAHRTAVVDDLKLAFRDRVVDLRGERCSRSAVCSILCSSGVGCAVSCMR